MSWLDICSIDDLVPNSGVCAMVAGQQVAIFCVQTDQTEQLFALGNFDPIGKANVISRGILGSIGEIWVVASPLYKQHFDLRTGQCIEQPEFNVPVFAIKSEKRRVWVNSQAVTITSSAA